MNAIQTRLAEEFEGQECLVYGAAPIVHSVALRDVHVAVNGGIYHTGGNTHVWVVNARTNDDARNHALYARMVAQGAGRHVGLLVLLTWGGNGEPDVDMLARLKTQGTTFDDVLEINNSTRRRIEADAGGRAPSMQKHALSAGLSAACLCVWAGAASVRLEGFSWTPGYAYSTPTTVTNRGHVYGDQVALVRLERRYGDRLRHALVIPDSIRRLAQKESVMPPRKTAPDAAPTVTAAPRTVRATDTTFYGNVRRREGDVFVLRSPSHFKPSCMVDVPADAQSERPNPAVKVEQARTIAQAMSGRRMRPNAADLEPQPALAYAGGSRDVL